MDFDPELWLRIKDKKVTAQQVRILSELAKTHSQNAAASNIGISVPVFHRHLKSLRDKLGMELVTTTPNGTHLTGEGKRLLKIYERYSEMLRAEQDIMICCTPITHEFLLEAITDLERSGKKYVISISSDTQNLKALYLNKADLVLFDDPNYAIEFEGLSEDKILVADIFSDALVHFEHGPEYIRYKYGAQRIGFRYLENVQKEFKILYEVSDYNHLFESGKSFFINQSLINRKGLKVPSTTDIEMFTHPIMAVSINPSDEIREIVNALKNFA